MVWLWAGFIALLLPMLALDLGVSCRKANVVGLDLGNGHSNIRTSGAPSNEPPNQPMKRTVACGARSSSAARQTLDGEEMRMRMVLIALVAAVLSGYASHRYRQTHLATFSGALDVRWVENDYFLFLPNPDRPFTLIREDQGVIRRGPMYTDGGSVPDFYGTRRRRRAMGRHLASR